MRHTGPPFHVVSFEFTKLFVTLWCCVIFNIMYAEEVYSRIANPDEMVSIRFNQTQHETDKYSKAKRRASKRVKKHFFSETSIILFMLTFFTSSCFLMMFYAPDVIDTVSIKLEEYTIIIDNYLPEGDENSSLIFQVRWTLVSTSRRHSCLLGSPENFFIASMNFSALKTVQNKLTLTFQRMIFYNSSRHGKPLKPILCKLVGLSWPLFTRR